MSIRRSVLALLAVAAIAFAACSSTGSSAAPSVEATAAPLPSIESAAPSVEPSMAASEEPSGSASASMSAGLQSFCADFQAKLAAAWPNIDASTAAALAPTVEAWATSPDVQPVKTDVSTIVAWIATQATAGSVASPPADVTTAFDDIKSFATSHCS